MWFALFACRRAPDPADSGPTPPAHSAAPHSAGPGSSEPPPHSAEPPGHSAPDSGGPTCWDGVFTGYLSIATEGLGDDVATSCGAPGVDDWVGRWVAPAAGRYVIALADVDSFVPVPSTLQVLDGCGGATLGCAVDTFSGQPTVVVDLARDEAVLLVMEAPHPYAPYYTAEVPLRVAPVEGSELGCLDGFDDDADGRIDCADPDCVAEPRCDCVAGELTAGSPLAGTTVGAGSALRTACSYYTGNDRSYRFVAPAAGTWAFEATSPSRAVVSVSDRCAGAEYACDSSAGAFTGGRVAMDLAAGEEVVVTVETMYGDDGFTVEVSGP